MKFILDKSNVPADKLFHPRLIECETRFLRDMQDETFRRHIALHEAGHDVYMRKAGAKTIFQPSVLWYLPKTDRFNVGFMSIAPLFPDGKKPSWDEIACWHVAGGVVGEQLIRGGNLVCSDKRDREEFWKLCSERNMTNDEIVNEWESARHLVERDLRNPAFKREVWQRADEIKAWLEKGDVLNLTT